MEGLTNDLYNRCRSILLACDEFQSNESLRAVFVSEGLGAYRDFIPEANRRDQRVDLCLDFLLHRRWNGETVLTLFLETLRDRYPKGDDLRNALNALARDVRTSLKQPATQSMQEVSPSLTQSSVDTLPGSKSGEATELQKEFRYDAFISYSHKDSDWVYSVLLPKLEQAGLRICIDYRDFEIGVPSMVNLENAVNLSSKTLLILTPSWIASEWTEFESLMIQAQDPTNLDRCLLPIMVQHCTLPKRLRIFTYPDLTKPTDVDRQIRRLVAAFHLSPLNQQPTATATIASFIRLRKNINHTTILFLGARAGGLFKNDALYNYVKGYSLVDFDSLSDNAKFGESYDILREHYNESNRHDILTASLRRLQYRQADTCLAKLINAGYFDIIITTNIDALLENALLHQKALRQEGLYPYQLVIRGLYRTDDIIRNDSKQGKIIKIFGDLESRHYHTAGDELKLGTDKKLEDYLKQTLARDILVIGYDPVWDQPLQRAFPDAGADVWYVNEEMPDSSSLLFHTVQSRKGKYLTGEQGSYERFITELYQLLSNDAPPFDAAI